MSPERNHEAGFSLIELLVVMTVMLLVTGATFGLFSDSLKFAATTYEMTEAEQNLRVAQEVISRDLLSTGDGLRGISNIRVPTSFAKAYLSLNPLTEPSDPTTATLGIVTSDDNIPANTTVAGTSPVVFVRSAPVLTDRITLLMADPAFTTVSLSAGAIVPSGANVSVSVGDINKFSAGEIYFISSSVGATFGVITSMNTHSNNLIFAAGDPYAMNQPGNGGPINIVTDKGTLPTSLKRMQIIHYFVDSNGLFIRRVFGVKGAAFIDSAIAEHIVGLQFTYHLNLVDTSGRIVQPVSQLATSLQQVQVRSVDVKMTAETAHLTQNGSHQQITSTGSWSVRNMQFIQSLQP
jgi:prepilin-type N-terminal cleavage/methylation domain-containing protein